MPMDYVKVLDSVSPSRTVSATGGCTITALNCACELIEDKDRLSMMLVNSVASFGGVKQYFDVGKHVWDPMVMFVETTVNGAKSQKKVTTPRRLFRVRIVPELPANVILLVSKRGKASKVVVS